MQLTTGACLCALVSVTNSSPASPPLASTDQLYGRWDRRMMGRGRFIGTWPSIGLGVQSSSTAAPHTRTQRRADALVASVSVSGSALGPTPPLPRVPLQWSAPLTILAEGDTYTGGRINQDTPGQRWVHVLWSLCVLVKRVSYIHCE